MINKINLILISFIVTSCTYDEKHPKRLNDILDDAGENRKELEAVIEHYNADPADSLKLKSAYFLIENLKGLKTLDTNSTQNDRYFDALNEAFEKNKTKFNLPSVAKIIDSVKNVEKLTATDTQISYLDDLKIVTSEFLINNIESSFYAWRNMPWAKHISFENFCEYILPYRCTNTYAKDGRNIFFAKYKGVLDSMKTTNTFKAAVPVMLDIDKWFTEDGEILRRYPFLQPAKFSDLVKGRIGECIDATSIRVAALRAIGIPVAMDQIPNWGNSNASHFWYKIIDPAQDTITKKLTNEHIQRRTDHIMSAITYVWEVPVQGYPKNVMINYVRTVPKVFRQCFSKQKNSLAVLSGGKDEIPPYFTNDRLQDVTTEYVECKDVIRKIEKNSISSEKYMYLCVFDNYGWKPVAWAVVKNQTALFKNIGTNIVYLPAYYRNGTIIPAGKPFLLKKEGVSINLNANGVKEKITLFTKYPYRTLVNLWQSYMVGGRFQFGNKADYSDTVNVYNVTNLPFYATTIEITTYKKFRYLIYQFKGLPTTFVSNLEFWGLDDKGIETKLTGKLIGNVGKLPYGIEKITDNSRTSYFTPKENDKSYIGLDLGVKNAKKITKIKYTARNDDNAVVPNLKYELFLWDNQWVSLGAQVGNKDKTVTFNNIPKNSLLLLKDTEGGTENRIFTYDGNQQVFW